MMNIFVLITVAVFITTTKAEVKSWVENGSKTAEDHNVHRLKHKDTDPLWASISLAGHAKDCARRMLEEDLDPRYHPCLPTGSSEGENIFVHDGRAGKGDLLKLAVDGWYNEIDDVNPKINVAGWFMTVDTNANIKHFFQVVWKSTTQVGCGGATNGNKSYLVCRYSPRGNNMSGAALRDNVKPPKIQASACKTDDDYCGYISVADCSGGFAAMYQADCPNKCGKC